MGMTFFAIAYAFQEDIFYDFAKKEDTFDFEHTCLLPTQELAEQYIKDELSTDYVPVSITITSYRENGTLAYSRGQVDRWDIVDDHARILSFQDAKEAILSYFAEEKIEDFGFTEEQFKEFVEDYQSPLYKEDFLRKTALCFDQLERTLTGFVAYAE